MQSPILTKERRRTLLPWNEIYIYINENTDIAWFDELLSTQMKLCRGSGVLKKVSGKWKIAHYVLSIVIPYENVSEVIQLKQGRDDKIIENLRKQ